MQINTRTALCKYIAGKTMDYVKPYVDQYHLRFVKDGYQYYKGPIDFNHKSISSYYLWARDRLFFLGVLTKY